tara:strand:- start:104 stop:553 length:450 start_codon:yes stop_codon:yes gene_type:complete
MEISAPYKILLSHLDWNIRHLKEILKYPKTIYYRDASIQRFGFTFNLTLKCLKTRIAKSSRVYSETEDWFLAAKEVGLLKDVGEWKLVIDDHNRIKDGFNNEEGESVYFNLKQHLILFEKLLGNLCLQDSTPAKRESLNENVEEFNEDS